MNHTLINPSLMKHVGLTIVAGGLATLWAQTGFAVNSGACPGIGNRLCLYSPVDPAGSKGSQSLAVGIGVTSGESPAIPSNQANPPTQIPEQVFRAHVTKGLAIPVDLGMILGSSETGQFQQAGLHAQWTIFEGFRLPAVTARAALLRSSWARGGDIIEMASINSRNIELLGSWGVLGILTPYAGVGWAEVGNDSTIQNFIGLEIQALPPFMRLGIESRKAFSNRYVLAKISLGL